MSLIGGLVDAAKVRLVPGGELVEKGGKTKSRPTKTNGDISNLSPGSSHVKPQLPEQDKGQIDRVSVEVTSEDMQGADGLLFTALQVRFDDETWAHGGPLQGSDGERAVNWGGLPNSDDDYAGAEADPDGTIERVINPQGINHVKPVDWVDGHRYEITIEKGDTVTVPAGEYQVLGPDSQTGTLEEDTQYQEWTLRVRDLDDGGKVVYEDELLNHAEHITDVSYWTETGYGFPADHEGSVEFSNPEYRTADDPNTDKPITDAKITYSAPGDPEHPEDGGTTAPDWSTSNTELVPGDTLTTRTTFATERTNPHGTMISTIGGSIASVSEAIASGGIAAYVGQICQQAANSDSGWVTDAQKRERFAAMVAQTWEST